MQVTYDFSGKSVLLIGGTTGIGRATANAFAKVGSEPVRGRPRRRSGREPQGTKSRR